MIPTADTPRYPSCIFQALFSFFFPFFSFLLFRRQGIHGYLNRYDSYDVTRLRGHDHMSSSRRAHQDMIHN